MMLRGAAAQALASFGDTNQQTIRLLDHLWSDSQANAFGKCAAAVALWRLEQNEARSLMVSNLLTSAPADDRAATAGNLGLLGRLAEPFVSVLKQIEADSDENVGQAAKAALAKIKPAEVETGSR